MTEYYAYLVTDYANSNNQLYGIVTRESEVGQLIAGPLYLPSSLALECIRHARENGCKQFSISFDLVQK
jgi:hypothetical protein